MGRFGAKGGSLQILVDVAVTMGFLIAWREDQGRMPGRVYAKNVRNLYSFETNINSIDYSSSLQKKIALVDRLA